MLIYIGADHRGFKLKEYLKSILKNEGYEVVDVKPELEEGDDYPDVASNLAYQVSLNNTNAKGILLCGSGAGVSIVANKFPHVRAALALNADQIYDAKSDEDINVLSISSDFTEPEVAKKILTTWLKTPFSEEERHKRRLKKISDLEGTMIRLPELEK